MRRASLFRAQSRPTSFAMTARQDHCDVDGHRALVEALLEDCLDGARSATGQEPQSRRSADAACTDEGDPTPMEIIPEIIGRLKCDSFLKHRECLASEPSFLLPVINLLNPIEKHTSRIAYVRRQGS
jgi:hypothetical protein